MDKKILLSEEEQKEILEMGEKDGLSLREINLDENQRTYVNAMAKGLAGFAFRNGPVEDMHADGKLSDEDMKTLNKFMVEKLAEYFAVLVAGDNDTLKSMDRLILTPPNLNIEWDDPTLSDLPYDLMLSEIKAKWGF